MSATDQETAERNRLAEQLVDQLIPLGAAARAEIPVTHVDTAGTLSLWKVTVERVRRLDFRGE